MEEKTYKAQTQEEAIVLVEKELGKNAIITNIKTITPKGIYKWFKKPYVEVTAVVKKEETLEDFKSIISDISKITSKMENQTSMVNTQNSVKDDVVKNTENVVNTSGDTAIEEKLNNLTKMLEHTIKNNEPDLKMEELDADLVKFNEYKNEIISILEENEVEQDFAERLVMEIPKSKEVELSTILSQIYQRIILKLGTPKIIKKTGNTYQPKLVYFIGPTGVGKTTSLAKLASLLKINEKLKIVLITSDTYRIAAVNQLETYANIIDLPFEVVYNKEDILEVIDKYYTYDYIFIDTAGRSHKNNEQREMIKDLLDINEYDKDVYLVVSATTKFKDLSKIIEEYETFTKFNVIFTKLDETTTLGNILNLKMVTDAKLSYITFGQNVPDDIEVISPQKIAKELLSNIED